MSTSTPPGASGEHEPPSEPETGQARPPAPDEHEPATPANSDLITRLREALSQEGLRPELHLPASTSIDLRGKRILLTGASSGIGEAAAEKFAAEGATVIAVARREDLLAAVVQRIADQGGEAIAMPTNLADLDAVDELVARVGDVDILINNAGRSIRRPLAESLERWHDAERTMAINYFAPLRLIRGLAPKMIERGDGHIINVSSWRVLPESAPLFSVYNASKAALSAISRAIETEWGELGVHSTTLYYPLVATPMIAPTRAYDGVLSLSSSEAADWMLTAARTRPVRIAPRKALTHQILGIMAPGQLNALTRRQTVWPDA
jgi:NAD(P)-dependent dehydrogenase (short-subunit alcohol dehydrogenase family)